MTRVAIVLRSLRDQRASFVLRITLTAVLVVAAFGCSPLQILIISPQMSEALTYKPLEIEVLISSNIDAGTLAVTLNGVDVTELLELQPGTGLWRAVDVWETDAPQLGENELIVSGSFNGVPISASRFFMTEGDAFADCVDDFVVGTNGGFGSEAETLGGPRGSGPLQGSTDVLSLGLGGSIVLEFRDNTIVDGPGVDFTVFENPFLPYDLFFETLAPFMEPGRVSVSQDGSTWYTFACALVVEEEASFHPGCAGVYPVLANELDGATPHGAIPTSTPIEDLLGQDIFEFPTPAGSGGDSFDLADVGLEWAAFVRIEGADFLTAPAGPSNAGFDLDAIAAVNSEPSGLDPSCP